MNCVIPGRFVKLFGRSIHCLSKIGDELYIEALKDGLGLRTVNSSRSAYGCFIFTDSFFHEYTDAPADATDSQDQNEEDTSKFKITMKSCLGVFKSLSNIDKIVDTCKIEFDQKESRIVFTMYCKHGITKTHNLTFQESESLQAVFSKDLCPNLIIAQAKTLLDTVANFPISCEEITMAVYPQHVKVKNYVEDEPDPSKIVHTEMTLAPEEFDNYQIGVDTEITYCLKELRAILAFSEFVNQPVNIHFESAGKPIVFTLDGDSLYEADFVLATLMDQNATSSQITQDSQTVRNHIEPVRDRNHTDPVKERNHTDPVKESKISERYKKPVPKKNNTSKTGNDKDMEPHTSKVKAGTTKNSNKQRIEDTEIDQAIEVDMEEQLTPTQGMTGKINQKKRKSCSPEPNERNVIAAGDDFFSDSFPYKDLFVKNQNQSSSTKVQSSSSTKVQSSSSTKVQSSSTKVGRRSNKQSQQYSQSISSRVSTRPITTPKNTQKDASIRSVELPDVGDSLHNDSDEVESDEFLPGTPPSKKFKSIFFGVGSLPKDASSISEAVLAADTDDED